MIDISAKITGIRGYWGSLVDTKTATPRSSTSALGEIEEWKNLFRLPLPQQRILLQIQLQRNLKEH